MKHIQSWQEYRLNEATVNFFTGKKVKDATFFPEGTLSKSASHIVKIAKSKRYAPKGIGSAIRYLTYFLNRGGEGLSKTQRRNIERARKTLQNLNKKSKESKKS
jgi:hypothetical protein